MSRTRTNGFADVTRLMPGDIFLFAGSQSPALLVCWNRVQIYGRVATVLWRNATEKFPETTLRTYRIKIISMEE